jgi:hypothetical protein
MLSGPGIALCGGCAKQSDIRNDVAVYGRKRRQRLRNESGEPNQHPPPSRNLLDADVRRQANRLPSDKASQRLGRVREACIVKGKSAIVAKVLFELPAKIGDGPADAACPAVLNTEVLPYGGLAKVGIFVLNLASGLEARPLLGRVEVSALQNDGLGQPTSLSNLYVILRR